MYSYLSNGHRFYYTLDADILSRYENGTPVATIVKDVSRHDRITVTAAKHRVAAAILKSKAFPADCESPFLRSP